MRRVGLVGVLAALLALVAQVRSQPRGPALPAWLQWPWQREQGPRRTLLACDSQEAFQVSITCDQPGPTTSSPLPLWTVDFGRPLQQANPLALFRVAGVYRADVVYQQQAGLLYVLGFVATRDQPVELSITVPAGVAADVGGAPNLAASSTLAYQPAASSLGWLGTAGSAAFGGTVALSFATGILGGGGVGMGVLGFANFVQTFYYSGTLPLSNMPENYKAVSSGFGWTSLATMPAVPGATSVPGPDSTSQAEDTLYSKQRFPYPPVVVATEASAAGSSGSTNESPAASGADAGVGSVQEGTSPPPQPQQQQDQQQGGSQAGAGGGEGGGQQGSSPAPGVGGGSTPADAPVSAPAPQPGAPEQTPVPLVPPATGGQQSPQPAASDNVFNPSQVDDPAFQNPPPEPDFPPVQQSPAPVPVRPASASSSPAPSPNSGGGSSSPVPGSRPVPSPTPVDVASPPPPGGTPVPSPSPTASPPTPSPSPATPTPSPTTPSPSPATPTPSPTTPSPSPTTPTPTPSPSPATPTPMPSPSPTPTPSPSPSSPTLSPSPTPTPASPPPPGGIVLPGSPPGGISGQEGNNTNVPAPPAPPPSPPVMESPPTPDVPIYTRKKSPPPSPFSSPSPPPPPVITLSPPPPSPQLVVHSPPPGKISGQEGDGGEDYTEPPAPPPTPPAPHWPPSPPDELPVYTRKRPPPPQPLPPAPPSPSPEPSDALTPPPPSPEPALEQSPPPSPLPPSPSPKPPPPSPEPALEQSPPPSPLPPSPSPKPPPPSPPPPHPKPKPPPPKPSPPKPSPYPPPPSPPPPKPKPPPPSPPPPRPKPHPPPPSPKPHPPPPSPKPHPPPPRHSPPPPPPPPPPAPKSSGGSLSDPVAAAAQAKPQAATAAVLIDTPLQQPGGGQGGAQELPAGRRLLINDPLSSLASSGFYVVTTVTVADVQNGTAHGSIETVSDAAVGASALSRIRAIQSAAAGEGAAQQSLQVLWNVCFWSALLIGGFAVAHFAFLLLLRFWKRTTPKMLHMPRLELLLFMMVLPMIVAAGAALLRAPSAGYVVAGVVFAVLLPAIFLATALTFVVRYLLRRSVEQRRAVYVLALPPRAAPATAAAAEPATPDSPVRTRAQRAAAAAALGRDSGSLTQQFLVTPTSTARTTDGLLSPGESMRSTELSPSSPPGAAQFISSRGSPSSQPAAGAASSQQQGGTVVSPSSSGFHTPASEPASPRQPADDRPPATCTGSSRSILGRAWGGFQHYFMRPVFGFTFGSSLPAGSPAAAGGQQAQQSSAAIPVGTAADVGALTGQGAWLCKGKWDTAFVKRYGSLFEDARGPQVYHITSAYDAAADAADGEQHVGSGVLVPATYAWGESTVQTLQTFGILLSVFKMVLFALIINAVGAVNSVPQILALVLVSLLHLAYLRLCLPFRMRIELAAEMVASLCDMGVFVCGIVLIARPTWTADERRTMGVAMLALQATGFLTFMVTRILLAARTLVLTLRPLLAGVFRRRHS